jgi:hypothetical protein
MKSKGSLPFSKQPTPALNLSHTSMSSGSLLRIKRNITNLTQFAQVMSSSHFSAFMFFLVHGKIRLLS